MDPKFWNSRLVPEGLVDPGLRGTQTRGQAAAVPHTVRPLQGLHSDKRGNSKLLVPGTMNQVIFEARTETEDSEVMNLVTQVTTANEEAPPLGAGPVIGILHWGIGGGNFNCRFDLITGTIISVPATYMKFSVNYPLSLLTAQPQIKVDGGLAYGSIGRRSAPARVTDDLDLILAGGFAISNIPPFALAFTILTSATAAAPVTPVQITQGGVPNSSRHIWIGNTNAVNQYEQQFPIYNGASNLVIENLSAVATFVKVIYTLAL